MSIYHTPVMLVESVSALIGNVDGVYADATFGGGGHTAQILESISPKGRVIAFDRDPDAIRNRMDDDRLLLVRNNFRFIHNYIVYEGYSDGIDGILADLGVSSHQFDTAERGFSFRFDAPLDMRMNPDGKITAADIVNSYDENRLAKILRLYGEVDGSGRIASLIGKARACAPILTTGDLTKAIEKALPKFAEHKFLAKVYQALRIEVNEEMKSLEKFLQGAVDSLKPGGRLVVITYHSLEDRMVKNFMKTGSIDGNVAKDIYGNSGNTLRPVTRKPVLPQESEIAANTRARSAKLRVAEKIGR